MARKGCEGKVAGDEWREGRSGFASFAGSSVATIATECKERVSKLLIPKGRFVKVPPPPVFCKKSAEVIENKGRGPEKERKERARVSKLLKY